VVHPEALQAVDWDNKVCGTLTGGRAIMSEKSRNVQDVFLNYLRENKVPVTLFLLNGIKLQGIIDWFDRFSVVLRRDRDSQLVYKSTMSTIMPMTPVQLFDGERPPQQTPRRI
jgi:host factor-I protein